MDGSGAVIYHLYIILFCGQRHHITIVSGLEVNSSKSRLCQLGRFTILICLL